MSIKTEIEVTLAEVEVTDAYEVGITVTDPVTMQQATIGLDLAQAEEFAQEILRAKAEAMEVCLQDRRKVVTISHPFDTDGPVAS